METITLPRVLSAEDQQRLESQEVTLSDFQKRKLDKFAKKNWDLFYKRNRDRFFKNRYWTTTEFEELLPPSSSNRVRALLEVGCGVGNFLIPLLENHKCQYRLYATDLSPIAIDILKENPLYDEAQIKAFVSDVTADDFVERVKRETNDVSSGTGHISIVTLIFCLSALNPSKMPIAAKNLFEILEPGGRLLFRDYGILDHAQIRFGENTKISDNFYARQDGTTSYFFSIEYVAKLFGDAGFEIKSNEYIYRATYNRKEGTRMDRVFVQSKFMKPN